MSKQNQNEKYEKQEEKDEKELSGQEEKARDIVAQLIAEGYDEEDNLTEWRDAGILK